MQALAAKTKVSGVHHTLQLDFECRTVVLHDPYKREILKQILLQMLVLLLSVIGSILATTNTIAVIVTICTVVMNIATFLTTMSPWVF